MDTLDSRRVRHSRTTDDGELAPLPPRSDLFGSGDDRFLSDRDVEVRTHASSLLGVPERNKTGSNRSLDHGSHRRLNRVALYRTPSGGRTWQNSSWDGKKMKSFIEETEEEPLQSSLPAVEEVRATPTENFIERRQKKKLVRTAALVGMMVMLALLIGLGFGLARKNRSSASDGPGAANAEEHSKRLNDIVSFLSNGFSDPSSLTITGSPQESAASWMANDDPLRYDVPLSATGEEAYHFIQRYALAVFYFALGGQNWNSRLNFIGDQHECAWFERNSELTNGDLAAGVMCDSYLHVEDILIPGNNLSGAIPPELGILTDLDFLSLENNNLIGPSFPAAFEGLTKLEHLNLNDNALSGTMPLWLPKLERLRVLGLSNNELEGAIPPMNLTNLRTLALDGNELTGDLSENVNELRSLKYLYLDDNRFTDVVDGTFLADLDGVVELGLSENKLRGPVPSHLFEIDTLLLLDVSNNMLNGTLDHIPQDSNLEWLGIDGNDIDTSQLPSFVQIILDASHTRTRPPESFAF